MIRGGVVGKGVVALMMLGAMVSSAWAGERVTVYDTFNHGRGAKYDLHAMWSIESKGSFWERKSIVGVPFVPEQNVMLRRVQLALWHIDGDNAYYVSLREDDNGVPGAFLHAFDAIQATAVGECCDTVSVTPHTIALTAGKTYWIVLKAKANTSGGWVYNWWHTPGTFAAKEKDAAVWEVKSDALPAIRIVGELMP